MLHTPPAPEGWIDTPAGGHSILIPSHVQQMDRFERKLWLAERKIKSFTPHWDGPGTNFGGAETLAFMTGNTGVVGPTAALLSVLTREAVMPIQSSYFNAVGRRMRMRAYGQISTTATVPTFQLQVVVGPTFANPLTSGQMLAQNAVITPAAAANLDWWLDVFITVRATGIGSLFCTGTLYNNWAASGTYVITPLRNANPPTAVTLSGSGFMVPIYFDIEVIMGAATAGNSVTGMDYELVSMN